LEITAIGKAAIRLGILINRDVYQENDGTDQNQMAGQDKEGPFAAHPNAQLVD
jgi:hypothetical protein